MNHEQEAKAAQAGVDRRLARAAEVIQLEARTIAGLEPLLDQRFADAVERIVACRGMLVVTGMGKAGLVGAKISATLASTGTPSLNLHPAEALHGDLGRIREHDLVLALSNSGETAEVKALVPRARAIGAGVIAMTGAPDSTLGQLADCVLDIGRVDEACPLGLAPTASTSAMLALGDALAMVVLAERGFSRDDYARYHPSGSLGRRLMKVREVMRQGDELPLVPAGTPITAALLTMSETKGRPGAAIVVDAEGHLAGLFTDGDLRRLLGQHDKGLLASQLEQPVDEFMTRAPKVAHPDQLLAEAERLLREHKKDQVPVVDDQGRPVGLLDVQDVLTTKV